MSDWNQLPSQAASDVLLLVQDGFPYVQNSRADWCLRLISNFPELRFSLMSIYQDDVELSTMLPYTCPDNLVAFEQVFLNHQAPELSKSSATNKAVPTQSIYELHDYWIEGKKEFPEGELNQVFDALGKELSAEWFLYSQDSWQEQCRRYSKLCPEQSFTDFLKVIRYSHLPLFHLVTRALKGTQARLIHALDASYAGFLASQLSWQTGSPMMLTDLSFQLEPDGRERLSLNEEEESCSRFVWRRFFHSLDNLSYQLADPLICRFYSEQQQRLKQNIAEDRILFIRDGIDDQYWQQRMMPAEQEDILPILLFRGRLVQESDVMGFVRLMRIIADSHPDVEGWVIGNFLDEELIAFCKELSQLYELEGILKFLGAWELEDILPQVRLSVHMALDANPSEEILQSFAAGIPVICSDVGLSRELVMGAEAEDKQLGSAGMVVPFADYPAFAEAILRLLDDEQHWLRTRGIALQRVERFYRQGDWQANYREVYDYYLQAAEVDDETA